VIKISGEFDDDDGEYGTDYDPNDVDPENGSEISNDNDQDYDSDNATESGDSDTKDVDSEVDPEISNDIDQDYDSDNFTESGDEYNPFTPPDYNNRDLDYNPFTPPDYNNRDLDYNPFTPPDYNNKEEIKDNSPEDHTEEEQNEFPENLSGKEEDIEENIEEYSETETIQQEERGAESDSEVQEQKPEITSSIETENIGSDQSTLIIQQESQEPFSRDKEGNIILDAETMEFFGEHVSSQDEMEVEALGEEMEELFNSYEEHGLEQERQELEESFEELYAQEQGLETSHELKQESRQEQEELEEILEESLTQEQGLDTSPELKSEDQQEQQELAENFEGNYMREQREEFNLEIERTQEYAEKKIIKESLHTKIKEKKQGLSPVREQSNKKNQEIELNFMQGAHQNVVQEEILKKVEKQKKQPLKESDKILYERYKQETRGRPIYRGKETKGYIKWKEYLKEEKEKQEEKTKLLPEKVKENNEKSKEIREYKEKWAQYLANSIKKSEFPEEIKEKLSNFLKKYQNLRELLERSKTKEISEKKLEKELARFEDILIEKRNIAKPLFMNFDWFRRYYNEMISKSGKMVANLYISKKTREFLSKISGRIEKQENLGSLYENAEQFEEFLDKSFQIKEKWALLLNNLIHEVPNKEISKEAKKELKAVIKKYCEIRAILFNNNILKEEKEKLIQGRIEIQNPRFFELFEILRRFHGIYDEYSRKRWEKSLTLEGKRTVRQLSQKLKAIKEEVVQEILKGDNSTLNKFKEILRVNLYKSTELNMKEKSKLIKIIQKKDISEEDKKIIKSLFSYGSDFNSFDLEILDYTYIDALFKQKDWNSLYYLGSEQLGGLRLIKGKKIDLERYAKIVSEFYREEVLKSRKMLGFKSKQLRFGGDINIKRKDFENPEEFEKIVRNRKKYLWYGLLYEISEILPGDIKHETIAGYTTGSLNSRWSKYVFKAVLNKGKGGKLHKLIYNFLNNFGLEKLKTTKGRYNWRLIFGLLESRFKRTTMEIHFSGNSLRSAEVNFIKKHDLINSGLNIRPGGDGGRDKIDLPMISIAFYIALGFMETEIHKILINHGIRCSVSTVRRRIREYWGSFEEAQIKFLKPMFHMLLKAQFELHEINDVYDRFTLNYIETMFENISYLKLKKNVSKKNLMNLSVINQLDGWEGKVKLRIPVKLLKKILIVYATLNKAIKDSRIREYLHEYETSYHRYGFMRQIHNQLGYPSWEEARKNIVVPLIIEDFRGEQSFEEIYSNYGWSKSYAHNHNKVSRTLFFGMRSEQLRQFLRNNRAIKTYNDFEEKFLSKKEKMVGKLPISLLNKLIFKFINVDKAQQELNSRGYTIFNFREEVEKLYSSWENAFKEVKIPFLINAFKRGADPVETYLKIGYSKSSSIHHNKISRNIFFDLNTEMVYLFLEKNSQVSSLEDFKLLYTRGF